MREAGQHRWSLAIGVDPGAQGAVVGLKVEGRVPVLAAPFGRYKAGTGFSASIQGALTWAQQSEGAVLRAVAAQEPAVLGSVLLLVEEPQVRPGQTGAAVQGWTAGAQAVSVWRTLRGAIPIPVNHKASSAMRLQTVDAAVWTKEMGCTLSGRSTAQQRKAWHMQQVRSLVDRGLLDRTATDLLSMGDGVADALLIAMLAAQRLERLEAP